MTMYLIANIEVTDDSWVPGYAEHVHDIVHKHGGKYLSRSANINTVAVSYTHLTLPTKA